MSATATRSARQDGDSIQVRFTPEAFAKPPGGVRRTALELLLALRDAGVNVSASTFVESVTAVSPTPSALKRGTLQAREAAFFAGRRLRRDGGVAHSLYYDQQLRVGNWPLVVTVNDMIHERFDVGGKALRAAKRLSVRRASLIVTPSKATASDVVAFFPDVRGRVITIPWAIGSAFLTEPRKPTAAADPPFLLYVGARSGYKNFAILIRALAGASDLDDVRLILAGGSRPDEEERRVLGAVLGTEDRFTYVPSPPDAALRRLYDDAAALVVTSRCEGFGLPLLEAMARGCPVASAEGGSTGEVAGGHAAMFDPDSPHACADAIRRAMALPQGQRDAAGLHARRYYWASTAGAYLEAYHAIRATSRRRGGQKLPSPTLRKIA